jgi:hypothetical protein
LGLQAWCWSCNQANTVTQVVNTAFPFVFNTGLSFNNCKLWNAHAKADKTWMRFKALFS